LSGASDELAPFRFGQRTRFSPDIPGLNAAALYLLGYKKIILDWSLWRIPHTPNANEIKIPSTLELNRLIH
jgi:hypothetical protein